MGGWVEYESPPSIAGVCVCACVRVCVCVGSPRTAIASRVCFLINRVNECLHLCYFPHGGDSRVHHQPVHRTLAAAGIINHVRCTTRYTPHFVTLMTISIS